MRATFGSVERVTHPASTPKCRTTPNLTELASRSTCRNPETHNMQIKTQGTVTK